MNKSAPGSYEEKLQFYEKLVATQPGVERKGATVPFTSLNGHMFSYLGKRGELALRLPPAERELFLAKYQTGLCRQYGVIQKEYVSVPDSLLRKTEELKKFFKVSYAYVSSLKPKASPRSKAQSKTKRTSRISRNT